MKPSQKIKDLTAKAFVPVIPENHLLKNVAGIIQTLSGSFTITDIKSVVVTPLAKSDHSENVPFNTIILKRQISEKFEIFDKKQKKTR